VFVVADASSRQTGELLADELEVLDLTTRVEVGSQATAGALHARGDHRAVVWIDGSGSARIWLAGEDAAEENIVYSDEPSSLALRTAEHLRGHLMPESEGAASHRGAQTHAAPSEPTLPPRFYLLGGPGFVVSSYAAPLPTFALAFLYRHWTRLSVGAFGSGSLVRNDWLADPEQLSTAQFSLGAEVALRWIDPPNGRFSSSLLLRSALRHLRVRSDKGGPMGKGTAHIWGPTFDLGFSGAYELTPWFSLGAESCLILGVPLDRTVTLDNGMEPGAMSPVLAGTEDLRPDVQVATSFVAIAHW